MSRIISERTDHYGNRIVIWVDSLNDMYCTVYFEDGGESTEIMGF